MGIAQPGSSQYTAEGGRRFCPAGQEKHRLSPAVRHSATGSQAQPWAETSFHSCQERPTRSGQQLNAGKPRQHPAGDAKGPQHRQQLGRTGVKPGVAAVHKGSIHLRVSRQRGKDILRLIQGLPVFRAALRQLFQQALCPQDQSGVLQGAARPCAVRLSGVPDPIPMSVIIAASPYNVSGSVPPFRPARPGGG